MGNKKKEEELKTKAIKVMDLLQHSADLGNKDALYTIAMVSLVRFFPDIVICSANDFFAQFPPNQYFELNPKRAYEHFQRFAAQTGNASAQSYIAFFHASGYGNVVPVDQGKAQLYYTFAANAGDRGAQLALGYRAWTGIGQKESCQQALSWYGSAAEQCEWAE